MTDKTLELLLSRLFIADASDEYPDGVIVAVAALRSHLEATGQWRWETHAEPLL